MALSQSQREKNLRSVTRSQSDYILRLERDLQTARRALKEATTESGPDSRGGVITRQGQTIQAVYRVLADSGHCDITTDYKLHEQVARALRAARDAGRQDAERQQDEPAHEAEILLTTLDRVSSERDRLKEQFKVQGGVLKQFQEQATDGGSGHAAEILLATLNRVTAERDAMKTVHDQEVHRIVVELSAVAGRAAIDREQMRQDYFRVAAQREEATARANELSEELRRMQDSEATSGQDRIWP